MKAAAGLELCCELHADGRVAGVQVTNARPLAAPALVGRPATEVLSLVPRLFSLCGAAQELAARLALRAAGATEIAAPTAEVGRQVALEAAREHLWRLLLDWPLPAELGHTRPIYAALHRRMQTASAEQAHALGEEIATLVRDKLLPAWSPLPTQLNEPNPPNPQSPPPTTQDLRAACAGGWLGPCLHTLLDPCCVEPAPAAPTLTPPTVLAPSLQPPTLQTPTLQPPTLQPPTLLTPRKATQWPQAWAGESSPASAPLPPADFCSAPRWQGQSMETGPLARHAAHPAVHAALNAGHASAARLLASVLDLLAWCAVLRGESPSGHRNQEGCAADSAVLGSHAALARVETARGPLLHALRLDGAQIAAYQIVAPTEWHFQDAGPYAHAARQLPPASASQQLVRLQRLALAFNPCVAFEVRLRHAASPSDPAQKEG